MIFILFHKLIHYVWAVLGGMFLPIEVLQRPYRDDSARSGGPCRSVRPLAGQVYSYFDLVMPGSSVLEVVSATSRPHHLAKVGDLDP